MASRGVYRSIYSALPDDPDFQKLTSDARLTLLVARVCGQAGPAAIFRYYPELLQAQTGLSAKRLEAALCTLEQAQWISREGVVLWIRNGLRHDPTTTLANVNHRKAVMNWLSGLPKVALIVTFCDYYSLPYPFATHPNPTRRPFESKDTDSDTDSDRNPVVVRCSTATDDSPQETNSNAVAHATESDSAPEPASKPDAAALLVEDIIAVTLAPASRPYARMLVARLPADRVRALLAETRGAVAEGRVKQTPAKLFTHLAQKALRARNGRPEARAP